MEIYLVGGAVRDKLLGLPLTERDWVVVGSTVAEMLAQGYLQVGKDFPVFLHPHTKEEYALARTERKTAPGYKGFSVFAAPEVTLEQDLQRRDLTINAIAQDSKGVLIDPFHGIDDLNQRVLRHVSAAFVEDPLRVLRVARFAARFGALGFKLAPETQTLLEHISVSGELDALVPERVWKELNRALETPMPARFFEVLYHCNALARIFPELAQLFHQPFASSVALTYLNATADLGGGERFAALAVPLAHYPHGQKDFEHLCTRLRVPTEYKELGRLLMTITPQTPTTAAEWVNILQTCDAFRRPARFMRCVNLCQRWRPDFAQQLQRAYDLCAPIQAQTLIAQGVCGADIGIALRQQRQAALRSNFEQNK
jgi:tRNA nucleotidyltransferase (CCA-adding enzyme)